MLVSSWLTRTVVVVATGLLLAGGGGRAQSTDAPVPATFAGRIAALSEPGGYFDTDNLISNERGYLHVLPTLTAANVRGGAYVGVGPDQNFSYIAAIRPAMAVIVDIRRDNLLLHLLFKALFDMAPTRADYLALLTGRPVPAADENWPTRSLQEIVSYVDGSPAVTGEALTTLRTQIEDRLGSFGVPLSDADRATITRFHDRFIAEGLSLRFNTTGRAPQWHYPTFRDLILADDGTGRPRNYLAAEADFQFVKGLQAADLVIPVVGDLGGPTALRAVAGFFRTLGLPLSAFYASNVEFYLWRDGSYAAFLDNIAAFPCTDEAVIIRSVFGRDGSVSEVAPVSTLTGVPLPRP